MIPDTLFDALVCGARIAVYHAWSHAFALSGGTPDEIDHIYAMTTEGTRERLEDGGDAPRHHLQIITP